MEFMTQEEVESVMQFVRSVPVPQTTLDINNAWVQNENIRMYKKLKQAIEVVKFYSNTPRAPFARECDGGLKAKEFLERHNLWTQ